MGLILRTLPQTGKRTRLNHELNRVLYISSCPKDEDIQTRVQSMERLILWLGAAAKGVLTGGVETL